MSTSTARRERFVNVFESIRDELVNYFASEAMPKDAVEWYKRVSAPGAIMPELFQNVFFV